jgi:hypothetical protein
MIRKWLTPTRIEKVPLFVCSMEKRLSANTELAALAAAGG